jgi:sec-independent protein translocase protein TatA
VPFEKLLIILVAAYLVFGPKRLPGTSRSLGKGVREFRDSVSGIAESPTASPEPAALASAAPVIAEQAHRDPANVKAALESLSEEDRRAVIASLSEAPASPDAPSG